ncbi:hypothetical protein Acr_27g0001210 [Actinidia rufa]|uniref:FBD domain-containing protein n=1 Tax=Actinidia rufa TaxID=165716 RepID=A0A7J0H5N2_9ERIC|nr:hypothetical protein Acr_27g0001210 [Actinidia rufa]
MSSIRKRKIAELALSISRKRKIVANATNNQFVGLHRNLLDNILERVPIRDAVRTSILSRKWRYIWSEIPQLVFDKQFFEQITRKGQLSVPAYKFVSVISKILLLHTGPILKFTLYIPNIQYDWEVHITQWLLFLSRNGLKEFSLDSSYFHPYKVSFPVPHCSNLTHLKLQTFIFKHPTMFGTIILGNLISLHLEKITFHSDIGRSVFHAPLLESLKFAGCTATDHFFILAPKLKTLSATDSGNLQLKYFKRSLNLSILSIALGKTAGNQGQDITTKWSTFLATVSNISKLSFDGFFLKLLDPGTLIAKRSVAFNNLEHLELNELSFDDLNQISCVLWLLNSSPNLRKLDMKVSKVGDNAMEQDLSFLEAPDCIKRMLNQLQTVKMTVNGLMAELLLIKNILACSPSLEKILVQYNGSVDARMGFGISIELMRFRRASTQAEIVYMKS